MVVFRYYDQESGRVAELTKRQYIQIKFGPNGRLIADELGDFVTCEATIFPNLTVLALYKNGKMAIFNDGSALAEKELIYRGCPASSPAIDGKYIWCVVPDINAIIRYSPQEDRVALRVGGGKIPAFGRPESLSIYIDKIYVCCPGLRKIRSVEKLRTIPSKTIWSSNSRFINIAVFTAGSTRCCPRVFMNWTD